MTKQEIEYVKTLNLSPKMEVLVKHPTYTDLWGFQYNWTNTDEGWYPMRKYDYLSRLEDINFQRKNIKRFTELGYKGAFHLLLMIKKNLKEICIYSCSICPLSPKKITKNIFLLFELQKKFSFPFL